MGSNGKKTLVITNGTLIDGSGSPPTPNDAIVIEGNRIKTTGQLPGDVNLEDRDHVQVIDASGQWIMPGLIDSHCHLSLGNPPVPGVDLAKGTISAEFGALRAARSARKILRSGVTSISAPGGTWFIDAAVRDAINAGLVEGPRVFCAGRFIITYGSIGDSDPSWVGTPEHSVGVLCNTLPEMITETRRQIKHGVDFIKLADDFWGEVQTISTEELRAVVEEAHRRNVPVAIHSRGAESTRAAAEAGVDWIHHADLADEAGLDAVAEAGSAIVPAITFMKTSLDLGLDFYKTQRDVDLTRRGVEGNIRVAERARALGIKVLSGTDTGAASIMTYGDFHATEGEILVRDAGYTPMEAIISLTRDNAITVGLENDVGVVQAGKLADVIILKADPIADIRVLQGGKNLAMVIKDGAIVDLNGQEVEEDQLVFAGAAV